MHDAPTEYTPYFTKWAIVGLKKYRKGYFTEHPEEIDG
jgi:hypothetical protein